LMVRRLSALRLHQVTTLQLSNWKVAAWLLGGDEELTTDEPSSTRTEGQPCALVLGTRLGDSAIPGNPPAPPLLARTMDSTGLLNSRIAGHAASYESPPTQELYEGSDRLEGLIREYERGQQRLEEASKETAAALKELQKHRVETCGSLEEIKEWKMEVQAEFASSQNFQRQLSEFMVHYERVISLDLGMSVNAGGPTREQTLRTLRMVQPVGGQPLWSVWLPARPLPGGW